MPRLSVTSVYCLVSSACVLLGACSDDTSPSSPSTGGAPSASGASGAATAGASSGAPAGGAPSSAGANSSAGLSGTGTVAGAGGGSGGAGGSSAGAAGSGQAGAAGGSGKCGTALFCDDFESYTGTPGAPWTVQKNAQGGVVIDGAQHKSGTKAVKLTLSGAAAYQQALISVTEPFPVANNAFYGRMMIYTTAAPNDGVHWTMIQGEGPAPAHAIQRALVRYGGQHMQRFMANYETGQGDPGSDCWKHSQTKMPEKTWACMEWYFDGATNTQKFWLNNTPIEDLTAVGKGEGCGKDGTGGNWYFPTFEKLSVGWESYQTDGAREVWIDDVAVGTAQIGCPP